VFGSVAAEAFNPVSDCRPDSRSYDSNKTIVDTYLRDKAAGEDAYLRFYRIQRTLAAAVEKSAMAELPSGKRFSHQRRIPRATLLAAKAALVAVDFSVCASFDELYDLVATTIGPIPGVGELTIYDTAHRLGAYLELSPNFVYVHAGVRDGLKALKIDHRRKKIAVSELPPAFGRLRPEQVEDCLCIYKRQLRAAS
jgi:hypothetical protein